MSQLTHGIATKNEKAIEKLKDRLAKVEEELKRRKGGRPKRDK